jgi:thiol-disulfide isomerase/thioredoxin
MKFDSTAWRAKAGGASPFIIMWTSGDWCWVGSGHSEKKLDIWLRLQHKDLNGNSYGSGNTADLIVQAHYGDATVQDDGELLVAERATVERVEHALRVDKIKKGLTKELAPALDVQKWFNASMDLKLEQFRGKVVLLDFWGTWCAPCVAKLPRTEELHQKYKDRGLVVIGVHSSNGGEKLAEFLKEKKVTFPVAHDTGETADRYGVESFPAYFLIDKNGKVVWAYSHSAPDEKQIVDLLK